ncbi:phage virion morphogenesis protein [Acinetobacter chinensis]|jgi:phage gpG-like protein|uniref:phage virion morphogenesis protein n=1 Tax=Acinetobacter chinensis TaxID=2004650 RepID=UPI0029348795|nr:phage virion morphogenesis protein [Acinetobacter chinensis]WOE40703.1 phage virion morphogenesis protein [Acinetobacter chinensis]
MSGVAITIEADGESAVMLALARLSDFDINKTDLFRKIGDLVVSNIRTRWERGEGLEGKWRLSGRVIREGGTTLRKDSHLIDSMTSNVLSNGVEIGTNKVYGAIHHFGGEINYEARMRRTYFRQNQRTGLVGNKFVRKARSNFIQESMGKPYKVNMPRRPFLGLTDTDEVDVLNLIEEHFTDE